MAVQFAKTRKPLISTWCGRKGGVVEHLVTTDTLGRRVIVHTWFDTMEVEVRAVKGDGRTPKFVEYGRIDLLSPSCAEIDAAVAKLAEEHFA